MSIALIQDFEVKQVITEALTEEQIQELQKSWQAVVSTDLPVQIGWPFSGREVIPPVGTDAAEMICLTVYDPLVAKLTKVRRRFIGENIAWGITQAGKTRLVGDFMKDVELWFSRASVYEVIQEIEKCKIALQNDAALATSLAPFVTVSRLDGYKLSVLQAAGLA